MYAFHGWATVRVKEDDAEETDQTRFREQRAIELVREAIREADDNFSFFDVRRSGNGLIVLNAHGLRNHRFQAVIDLFRRVAEMLPDSYGLLYVHDDEDPAHSNDFQVWRLVLGRCAVHSDPFLSPYYPTVEMERNLQVRYSSNPWGISSKSGAM